MARRTTLTFSTAVTRLGGEEIVAQQLGIPLRRMRQYLAERYLPVRLQVDFLVLCVRMNVLWRPAGWPADVQLRVKPPAAGVRAIRRQAQLEQLEAAA
jgi:hypothetical protein